MKISLSKECLLDDLFFGDSLGRSNSSPPLSILSVLYIVCRSIRVYITCGRARSDGKLLTFVISGETVREFAHDNVFWQQFWRINIFSMCFYFSLKYPKKDGCYFYTLSLDEQPSLSDAILDLALLMNGARESEHFQLPINAIWCASHRIDRLEGLRYHVLHELSKGKV